MGRKRLIKKIIILSFALGGIFLLKYFFGPGWRLLADFEDVDVRIDTLNSQQYSVTTYFNIQDKNEIDEFFLAGSGECKVSIYINEIEIKKPLSLKKGSSDLHFTVANDYNLFANVYLESIKNRLKDGKNKIEVVFVDYRGDTRPKIKNWKLWANFKSWYFHKPKRRFTVFNGDTIANNNLRMYIETKEFIIPDEPKVSAKFKITSAGELIHSFIAKVEVRGSTSTNFSQVSFSIKSPALLDFSKIIADAKPSRNWILYAPYLDLSLIRNSLAYDLYAEMGHFATKSIPIELVVNGNHAGMYYLVERIDGAPASLNLQSCEFKNPEIPTPFLAEIGQVKATDHVVQHSLGWAIIHDLKYNKSLNQSIYEDAGNALEQMERWILENNNNLDKLIDYEYFADFIIMQELFKNIDAYRLSTFFHRKCDKMDSLIKAGPIWDFNLTLGVSVDRNGNKFNGWIYQSGDGVDKIWPKLIMNKRFNSFLKNRYRFLRKKILSAENIQTKIAAHLNAIKPYEEVHDLRYSWPKKNFWPYKVVPKNRKEEIDQIKSFILNRLVWMDTQWENN